MSNYTVLHLHSPFSNGVTNIDSITYYCLYIEKAQSLGMKAMAFTEHGNVFSWLHKKEEIEKAGMKYIHGIEAYITETLDEKMRDNYHCVLLAKNYDGVKEINKLSSESFNREDGHFYYAPRILFDDLLKTSDNVIITTACLGGILHNGNEEIKDRFLSFLIENKHRCFLEIQQHCDAKGEQAEYNRKLWEISKQTGLRLTVGTDTHALNDIHMEGRAILQKSKKVSFEDEASWDLVFRSYDELIEMFKRQGALPEGVVREALENTNTIADMVEEFTVDRSYKYPDLWDEPEKLLRHKISNGIVRRGVKNYTNYQEYLDRIEYEMKAYKHNKSIDFMLLMEDIVAWCYAHGIEIGFGRGSVNGSVIAWLLGITEMDAIKHNLNFDRFMNIERVSLSDIDTDFPPSRINEVKDYIFSRHGLYCSDIVTFNTISDKGAIRDVARALEMPLELVGEICDAVDDEKKYAEVRKTYKELFKYVDLVKGVIVSVGSHPCGCIVAPYDIDDTIGLFTTSTSKYPVSQLNMKEVDSMNYVKLDLLKLDTIEIINQTCKLAGIERLTPDNVDINDIKVWNAIRDNTVQIFQWEGSTGNDYIKKLLSDENIKKFQKVNPNVDRMTLLSIGNSAIRPAGASYREDLANGVVRLTGSPAIDDFLSDTFGYLVFQCQIIDFLHLYCGFTMGEADIVRRGFAKKTGTDKYIPRIKEGFIDTMMNKYGSTREKAEEDIVAFIQVIEDASRYLFSKNHSQPYSFEGYVCGWLRTYYPLEFLTVSLNVNKDKAEKTQALTTYAQSIGISIKSPVFRKSKAEYFCDKYTNTIYKGVESLKFLNGEVGNQLFEIGKEQIKSFVDLLLRISVDSITDSRQLTTLIKIGYFSEFGSVGKLMFMYEAFCKLFDKTKKVFKKQIKRDKVGEYGLTEELVESYSHKVTEKTYMMVDVYGILNELEKQPYPEYPTERLASFQQIILGNVDVTDPKAGGVCVIGSVNDKYTPKISGYSLKNGGYIDFKVPKRAFDLQKLVEGDVIKIVDYMYKPCKTKNADGKWVDVPNSKELWILNYVVLYESELRK